MPKMYFSFDVESDGLTGKAFAVGWVVLDDNGKELESGYHRSEYQPKDEWVIKNIVPHLPPPNCKSDKEMMGAFWLNWMRYEGRGATLVGDCIFPVETNFLSACIAALCPEGIDPIEISPYPVIDVASALFSIGEDPLGERGRLPSELPAHDPVCDARQSGRVLIEVLRDLAFG